MCVVGVPGFGFGTGCGAGFDVVAVFATVVSTAAFGAALIAAFADEPQPASARSATAATATRER